MKILVLATCDKSFFWLCGRARASVSLRICHKGRSHFRGISSGQQNRTAVPKFSEFSARPSLFHVISAMMTETDSRSVREGGEEALSRAPIAIAASGNKRLTSILQKTRSSGKFHIVGLIRKSMRIRMDAQSILVKNRFSVRFHW